MRPARKALRFTHLLARNWRNFLKADADLGARVFLAGPNASGKSGFLDVFGFLQDLVSPGLGFQEAVSKRGGVRMLRCLATRQESDVALVVHVGDASNPAEWEYKLAFNQEGARRPAIRRERLSRAGEEILVRPDGEDETDPERLNHSVLEQGGVRRDIREFTS
ncbi:MAG TPA: AAA family ATPase, partial [Bryobacteraceae bacterium]|nr:AAA family ATPase [Bryobacteraceae bacterium]